MPGAPKKAARKFRVLEDEATRLAVHTAQAKPNHYRVNEVPGSEIGRAWLACLNVAVEAAETYERLGRLLRARAGISDQEPLWGLPDGWLSNNVGVEHAQREDSIDARFPCDDAETLPGDPVCY